MGDGAGGHVVERSRQPALPHRHGDVRQRGSNCWLRHARLLTADLHGFTHFLQEGGGPIVNDARHIGRNQKKETKLKRKEKCQNQRKMRKEETEIKVRYSDTFTGNNTKKKNAKRKMKRKMQTGKHKIIQHLRQKGGRHRVR